MNEEELKEALEMLIRLRPCTLAVNVMKGIIEAFRDKGLLPTDCSSVEAERDAEIAEREKLEKLCEQFVRDYIDCSRSGNG